VFRPKLTEIIICQNFGNIEASFEADRMLNADLNHVGKKSPIVLLFSYYSTQT
jgi:hypothetical protein